MSSNTLQVRIDIASDDGDPIVIDGEEQLDEICRILSNERRRQVLCVLRRESLPIDVRTLARQVTIQEACDNSKMVTEESITQVHTTLYQQHLPMMADIGLIEYNTEETIEEASGRVDSVRA
jgi:DNA-binding transcriptional ArsR family regulator